GGADHPALPPPAPAPGRAGPPLPPDRRPGYSGRTQKPRHPPVAQRADDRAGAATQRLDGAARPPGPALATPGEARSPGPGQQRTPRGRSRGPDLPPRQRAPLLPLDRQRRLRWRRLPAFSRFPPHGRGAVVPRRVLERPGPAGAGPVGRRPRTGRLGAVGAYLVAGDPAVPALRRHPGVHPGRGTAVQRQRGELQRLVPRAALPATLSSSGRRAPRPGAAPGGRQSPALAPGAAGADADAAPPRPAAAETAGALRGADRAPAAGRGARDLHPPREQGWDGHRAEPDVSGRQEASGSLSTADRGHGSQLADRVPKWPHPQALDLQTVERLTDT